MNYLNAYVTYLSTESECISTSAATASSAREPTWHSATAASKEHLEYFIWIAVKPVTTMSRVLNFLDIGTLVVSCLLLWIAQHRVCFTDVLKHLVSIGLLLFVAIGVLVRVPLECLSLVSLLDFVLARILAYLHYLVVILSLGLFEFEFGILQFLPQLGGLGVKGLDSL